MSHYQFSEAQKNYAFIYTIRTHVLTHLVHRNVIHTRVAVEIEKTARQNEREKEREEEKNEFEAVIVVSHTGHFQDRFMYFILRGSVQAHIFNRLLSQRTDMSTTEHARINAKRFRFWAETDEKKIPFLISFQNFFFGFYSDSVHSIYVRCSVELHEDEAQQQRA